jgi:peptide/nickel transport system substrate-binding protein
MRFFALIALIGALSGCTWNHPAATLDAAARPDRLVIGQGREFNSLLPFANNGFTTSELIGLAFSLLVTLDARGDVADAATTVPTQANGGISRDGLTYTYHLRRNIRWQDGQPLTARDVLFTQKTVMNPSTLMPYRDGFDRVAAMRAPDPYTVVVQLRRPYRLFVTNFLGPESPTGILPAHLLAGVADIARSAYAAAPIGSGPFRIGAWHHGESVSFTANPQWYGGRPGLEQIDVRFIPEAATRLTQLRTHEIDAELGASAETAAQMRGVPGVRLDAESGPIFMQMTFNLRDPLVGQRPLRLAIAQAIDRRTIARKVSHGFIDGREPGGGRTNSTTVARRGYRCGAQNL